MAGSPKKRMRRALEAAATAGAVNAIVAANARNAGWDGAGLQVKQTDNDEALFAAEPAGGLAATADAAPAAAAGKQESMTRPEGGAAIRGEVLPGDPIFSSAEEFRRVADAYFRDCDACGKLYGEAGLCLWLSEHNRGGRRVTLDTLRRWYDGERCEYLQEEVQTAYLRIQDQVETDPRYMTKTMTTRAIFVQKQPRLGGYQDKVEEKTDSTVRIILGDGVGAESFG